MELARRMGCALADFRVLFRFWKHAAVSRARKVEVLNAVIFSKLCYGLSTVWLGAAERRRLDGFQCRCLRSVWGILPAFLSRVVNKDVWARTQQVQLSKQILRQQLHLFGEVARADDSSAMRDYVFRKGTVDLQLDRYVRRRGRPQLEWSNDLWKIALRMCSSAQILRSCIYDEAE